MTITDGPDIIQRLLTDRPSFHLSGTAHWDALPGTLEAIRRYSRPGDSTMEVGVGVSTVVFAASGANHVAISPDPAEHERVRSYCEQIGIDNSRITFAVGLSDDILPSLLGRDRTLDMAFIDGAHSYPVPVVDWYYITRSLKIGGTLLMDDITIPAAGQVFRHMRLEPNWCLEGVFDKRSAAFTLLSRPKPEDDWYHQPFNKGYPDFCFAGLPERLRLRASYRTVQIRSKIGERYPALRRVYKRLK